MSLRPDLEKEEIWVYILNYYKMLTADTMCSNIKNMSYNDIKKLYAARVFHLAPGSYPTPEDPGKEENINKYRTYGTEKHDYQRLKESMAIKTKNAGRYLACLILAKSYSDELLPYDPFDAKRFLQENFKGSVEEVFDKYCEKNKENKTEILSYYRNIAERNRIKASPQRQHQKEFSTANLLANTFLRITK